jgi:threonylcarbamoyladenosine tRNA methylthiotransferase MtaB
MQLDYARRFVGDTLEVIPERTYKGAPDSGLMMGYSDNYLNVVFPGTEAMIGQICRVKLTEAGVNECKGELVSIAEEPPASRPAVNM